MKNDPQHVDRSLIRARNIAVHGVRASIPCDSATLPAA